MQPDQDKIDASIRADHPFAPYITYEPTPYDVDLTDDPDVGRREFQVGYEARVKNCRDFITRQSHLTEPDRHEPEPGIG
jgi:hypothetical protein